MDEHKPTLIKDAILNQAVSVPLAERLEQLPEEKR